MVVDLELNQAPKTLDFFKMLKCIGPKQICNPVWLHLNVGMNLWKLLCGEVVGLFEERSCCLFLGLILIFVGSQPTTMGDYPFRLAETPGCTRTWHHKGKDTGATIDGIDSSTIQYSTILRFQHSVVMIFIIPWRAMTNQCRKWWRQSDQRDKPQTSRTNQTCPALCQIIPGLLHHPFIVLQWGKLDQEPLNLSTVRVWSCCATGSKRWFCYAGWWSKFSSLVAVFFLGL